MQTLLHLLNRILTFDLIAYIETFLIFELTEKCFRLVKCT